MSSQPKPDVIQRLDDLLAIVLGKRGPEQEINQRTPKRSRLREEDVVIVSTQKVPTGSRAVKQTGINGARFRDILFKFKAIYFLEPIDLLNLARTSKQLRKALMTHAAASTWKRARRNVPQMPSCPPDLSEPIFIPKASCRISKYFPEELKDLLSFMDNTMQPFILIEKREKWRESYKEAEDKERWIAMKREQLSTIDQQTKKFFEWYNNLDRLRNEQLMKDRKQQIIHHITHTMGWNDEYKKIPQGVKKPEDFSRLKKLCQKPITLTALAPLELAIKNYMESLRNTRLAKERKVVLNKSLSETEKSYKSFLLTMHPKAPYPTAQHVLSDPVIQSIVENTPEILPRLDWDSAFQAAIRRWHRAGEEKLENLILGTCGQIHDRPTILDRATTWFRCGLCRAAMRHPRALVHNGVLEFNREDLKCLTKVVQVCGLDPKVATVHELDALKPIVECVTCNNDRVGRAMMVWSRVLDHAKHENWDKVKLELVSDDERALVHERMAETEARQKRDPSYRQLSCRHCLLKGNILDLTKHVKERHGLANPNGQDIIPVLDADHRPDVFWLWPPRAA
ncbi:hypothetical protein CVT26_005935 [Gymnopilus dilepis]|uniref:F-box domain-containing protein n=1 Tax=Gymnopilus dilepis TaxID=231916 RepID=A0A409Y1V9_9AGAR|nr:hypothetical protein CVT26_005935 [Gymnopilus dilepis]